MIRNYNQLTIKQFLKIKTISDVEQDPLRRKVLILSEITGRDADEIESMPIGDMLKELKGLDEIETLQSDEKIKLKFKVGGRRFIVKWREQDLTSEQFIDASFFCKDQANIVNNIHNILAAISVERNWYGKELGYKGENHKDIANLFFNEMKISQAYPIMLFFCRYYRELHKNILSYLELEVEEQMKKVKPILEKFQHLEKSGDGLQVSMN